MKRLTLNAEVMNILSSTNAKPTYDKDAKVNYLVYGQNNWISYDDKRTFQDKIDFANDRGLNGLMIWVIDLDDSKHTALSALTGTNVTVGTDLLALENSQSVKHHTDDASQCRVSDCGSMCKNGERTVGRVKSKGGKNA
jgi:GH18 family chitinase